MNKPLSLIFAGVLLSAISLPTFAAGDGYHMHDGESHQGHVHQGDSTDLDTVLGDILDDRSGGMDSDYMMHDGDASMSSSPWDAAPVTHQQNDSMHKMTIESEEF